MIRFGTVITRRGNDVSYVAVGPDGGGKAPVLLVHPINLRKECWTDLVRVLAGDRLCVALDLSGHGESSDSMEFSLDGWVSDCRDVATTLGLGRCHLAGGSLGGTIALCLAGEPGPTALSALSVTAMGSSLGGEPDPTDEPGPDVLSLLDTGTVDELFAVLAREAVAPGAPDELVRTVRHLTNSHGAQIIRRVLSATLAADATPWVPGVECPVLVLTGEFDTSSPPDAGRSMAGSVGGRHEILPGVGHLPMLEDAAAVAGLLVPHLESAESTVEAR